MNKSLLLFIILLSVGTHAQVKLKNAFYEIQIPDKTTLRYFKSTNEELANIDIYEFSVSSKPKYLFWLMSNKLNSKIDSIDKDNCNDFITDLENVTILDIKNLSKGVVIYGYSNDNVKVKCVIYITFHNDILDRFFFMIPGQDTYETFKNEIDDMVKSIIDLKEKW